MAGPSLTDTCKYTFYLQVPHRATPINRIGTTLIDCIRDSQIRASRIDANAVDFPPREIVYYPNSYDITTL